MSNPYNTDGMLVYPASDESRVEMNAFQSIECAIAFDTKDWSTDRRDAWIYAIVFGWESWDAVAALHGWDDSDRQRALKYHEQWEEAKRRGKNEL